MFSLKNFMSRTVEENTFVIQVGKEDYKIRRLDGIDLIRLQDIPETEKKFVHILSVCLLDGETSTPLGAECAFRLLRENLSAAIEIINKIIDLSEEIQRLEKKEYESAKKNFKTTDTLS
ncbi:MAG: hypothetical protein Q4G69_00820 [Planctomycetia bacterium]|nr:hypothetical protein [Planctomycetia bacterium]